MVPDDRNREMYPVTKEMEKQLHVNGLLEDDAPPKPLCGHLTFDAMSLSAMEYIGEYEHGSVELNTLMLDRLSTQYEYLSDEGKRDMLSFAADTIVDFLHYMREVNK